VEKGDGAPSTGTSTGSKRTEKHPAAPRHSKKRPRSSETTEVLENPTSKHRRIIQNWSNEEEEENLTTDLLNPRRKKGCRADGLGGTIETSSGTSSRDTDGINCGYVPCAATK
jgi:hypothetical protein